MVCEIIFLKSVISQRQTFPWIRSLEVKTQQDVLKYSQSPNNNNIKMLRSKSLIEVSNITCISQI